MNEVGVTETRAPADDRAAENARAGRQQLVGWTSTRSLVCLVARDVEELNAHGRRVREHVLFAVAPPVYDGPAFRDALRDAGWDTRAVEHGWEARLLAPVTGGGLS